MNSSIRLHRVVGVAIYRVRVSRSESEGTTRTKVLAPGVCGLSGNTLGGPHRNLRFKGMVIRAEIIVEESHIGKLWIGDNKVLGKCIGSQHRAKPCQCRQSGI